MSSGLTIGYISGIIATAVFINSTGFHPECNCVDYNGPRQTDESGNNMVRPGLFSWMAVQVADVIRTIVARELYKSLWPTLLSTDSQTNIGVPRSVLLGSWSRKIASYLISVTAIVTPMGLYDTISPNSNQVLQPFGYASDDSSMGFGTPPRSDLGFNRICGLYSLIACPGQSLVIVNDTNTGTITYPHNYNISIPKNVTDAFQSGLASFSPTVSSIWDIEWRSYNIMTDPNLQNGSQHVVGQYRQVQNMVLNNAVEPVDGLIVDTRNGGIGFRNHSTPSPQIYGSTWSEDLLFVEPQTSCVDMNLTIDFSLNFSSSAPSSSMQNVVLTDRGGFANLIQTYPEYNHDDPQSDIQLEQRAYKAAWLSNVMAMAYLNVTNPKTGNYSSAFEYLNSKVGQTFPLPQETFGTYAFAYDAFVTTKTWGAWLNIPASPLNLTTRSSSPTYPNPFHITSANFTDVSVLCQGAGGADLANITNVGVVCGQIYGAARPADGSSSLIFEPGSQWSVPLYSCASGSRAIIKTVDFVYNGTAGLKSLQVTNVADKQYANASDMPLWGVENTQDQIQNVHPLWGLVSPAYKGRSDLSVIQKDSLWLPGWSDSTFGPVMTSGDNLAGSRFHTMMLGTAYSLDQLDVKIQHTTDYTAAGNLAMYAQWQKYSRQPETTSTIINLIWTDLAANSVVGTRGWLNGAGSSSPNNAVQKRDASGNQTRNVNIVVYNRVIRYKGYFAIPAIITLLVVILLTLEMLFLMIFARARLSYLRMYLNHTSVSRIMTNFLYPGLTDPQAPTKVWAPVAGTKNIDIGGPVPRAVDPIMMVNYGLKTDPEDPLLYKRNMHVNVHES